MESLHGKVFAILAAQLTLTWATAVALIAWFRRRQREGAPWIKEGWNAAGQPDLELDWQATKPYCILLCLSNLLVFLLLLFVAQPYLPLAIPLFVLWTLLTGLEIGVALVATDENIGPRLVGLVVLIVLASGVGGWVAEVDASFLGMLLFLALIALILFDLVRFFFTFYVWADRLIALGAVALFTLYLYFDFNRLKRLERYADANSWTVAIDMSISIYLDIVNLLLRLLDLYST